MSSQTFLHLRAGIHRARVRAAKAESRAATAFALAQRFRGERDRARWEADDLRVKLAAADVVLGEAMRLLEHESNT